MVMDAAINLQTDYVTIPVFASSEMESIGAEAYITNLMAKHKEYLSSIFFGAAVIILSMNLWGAWYRHYFAKVTGK